MEDSPKRSTETFVEFYHQLEEADRRLPALLKQNPLNRLLFGANPSNLGSGRISPGKMASLRPIHVIETMSSDTELPRNQKGALIHVLRSINAQVLSKGGSSKNMESVGHCKCSISHFMHTYVHIHAYNDDSIMYTI